MSANENKNTRVLWESLNGIQAVLGVNDLSYSEMLGLTQTRFRQMKRDQKDLPLSAITGLSEILPVSIDNIVSGKVDYKAVDAQIVKGNTEYLPERYTTGALSKRRSSINALFYIESLQGYRSLKNLLNHFHVNPVVFEQADANISLFFLQDITDRLEKLNFKPRHFYEIGKASTTVNKESALGRALTPSRSVAEVYDRFVGEFVPILETNFQYVIHKMSATGCVTRTYLKSTTQEALQTHRYGNKPLCFVRQGLVAALPGYLGIGDAKVKKTKCIYDGDDYCEMHIDFPKLRQKPKLHA